MKKIWPIFIVLATAVVIAGAVFWFRPRPLIPPEINNQFTSVILVAKNPQVKNNPDTVKYDNKLKLLSYHTTAYGVDTIISEQPTPESFIDIPQVYQKVLESWKQYKSFDTTLGTVYLTRPGDQNGKVVGVLNSKGTLMFVKPEKDLTDDQWRLFFKSLQTQD